ncbi:hypothetical protein DYB30_003250 [Aphanomyces astaci]|uniref:Uncharacterized protein n=1 Tax=Aphanomyces astaci TaxID=112090 RepID=A0A397E217_APHAT|nr:hypothetical protein DYB30_003250 [Aphanomyces astaci]RHY72014.1 hypothetical protein DYB38_006084 [Aphanomyces astaci]
MYIADHSAHMREAELLAREQRSHVEQIQLQHAAVLAERAVWTLRLESLTTQLAKLSHDQETQKQWHERFRLHACSPSIHPLADDVFARFGQSIALLPTTESPHVVRAGCLDFLACILRETTTDAVLGPVLIGLLHVSIYVPPGGSSPSPLRHEIVKAGTLPPLVRICDVVTNPAILTEAARLLASLASTPLNKTAMAAKHAVRAMAKLLTTYETNAVMYKSVLQFALVALSNLTHDVLRTQVAQSGVVPCIARLLADVPDISVRIAAAHTLANIGFAGTTNQGAVFMAQGDMELIKQLGATAKALQSPVTMSIPLTSPPATSQPPVLGRSSESHLLQHCARGLANLASTKVNQISIGYSDALPTMLQQMVDSNDAPVLTAYGFLCHQCKVNKVRVAGQNGLAVLLYVVATAERFHHNPDVLSATCLAIASVVAMDANLRILEDMDGHDVLLALCMSTMNVRVLDASGRAIAAMAPTLEYKHSVWQQGKPFKVQDSGGLAALERVAALVYNNTSSSSSSNTTSKDLPTWLQHGLDVFRMTPSTMELDHDGLVCLCLFRPARLCIHVEQMALALASGQPHDVTNPKSDEADSVWDEVFARDAVAVEALVPIAPDALCSTFYTS